MPAPLARGLILSITVLIAAGIAVYEHPQVRQWVDKSRRKIAVALHSLGDEINPNPPNQRFPPDPSTRPDDSPEAEERRRQARQEILERGRALQEKRNQRKNSNNQKSQSFDDLVDGNGSLINEKEEASTTAADIEPQNEDHDLRRRVVDADTATLGSATTRSSTPTLAMSPASEAIDRTLPSDLVIDTDIISNHSSEALIDLTPTTSNASTADAEIPDSLIPLPTRQDSPWSFHEWAESTSSSFHSFPLEEHPSSAGNDSDEESPIHEEIDADVRSLSHVGTNSDTESDDGQTTGTRTPAGWSEIGSVVSEDF